MDLEDEKTQTIDNRETIAVPLRTNNIESNHVNVNNNINQPYISDFGISDLQCTLLIETPNLLMDLIYLSHATIREIPLNFDQLNYRMQFAINEIYSTPLCLEFIKTHVMPSITAPNTSITTSMINDWQDQLNQCELYEEIDLYDRSQQYNFAKYSNPLSTIQEMFLEYILQDLSTKHNFYEWNKSIVDHIVPLLSFPDVPEYSEPLIKNINQIFANLGTNIQLYYSFHNTDMQLFLDVLDATRRSNNDLNIVHLN